jgi:hypothetical protein
VIGTQCDPHEFLTGEQRAFLSRIGTRVVQLKPAGSGADVIDARGEYARWFDALGVAALVVRPDFYLFGGARAPQDLGQLVEDLRRQLAIIDQ